MSRPRPGTLVAGEFDLIRVFRGEPGEPLQRARSRTPLLSAADGGAVRAHLASASSLEPREATAIDRALAELDDAKDADIVIAPGGSLYRTFASDGPAAAPPTAPPPSPPRWAAADRTARVLLADASSHVARLGELFTFLGYDARTLAGANAGAVAAELERHDSDVLLFPESLAATLEPAVRAARERGRGVVLIGQPSRDGVVADSVLLLPLASAKIASVVDPVVERVRARKL